MFQKGLKANFCCWVWGKEKSIHMFSLLGFDRTWLLFADDSIFLNWYLTEPLDKLRKESRSGLVVEAVCYHPWGPWFDLCWWQIHQDTEQPSFFIDEDCVPPIYRRGTVFILPCLFFRGGRVRLGHRQWEVISLYYSTVL